VLLEVDRNDVRNQVLTSLFREVRGVLRDARINLANHVTVRSGSVEVRGPQARRHRADLLEHRP
jgi:hypothetical protein